MAPAIAVVSPKKLAFYANFWKITTVADAIFMLLCYHKNQKALFRFCLIAQSLQLLV